MCWGEGGGGGEVRVGRSGVSLIVGQQQVLSPHSNISRAVPGSWPSPRIVFLAIGRPGYSVVRHSLSKNFIYCGFSKSGTLKRICCMVLWW